MAEDAKDVRDMTLAEVATSRRLLVVIGMLVVIAVAALVVFFIRPGDARGPGGNRCANSAAYSCEDFEDPKGGG